jgi:hypothetical protein
MTLVVIDDDGIAHEVYNKTEVRESQARHDWVENWQVRTFCCKDDELDALQAGISRATLDDTEHGRHFITCVRCVSVECDHGVGFDKSMADRFGMTSNEIRSRWPRLEGTCRKGCGYHGIAYASYAHYIYGDW